MKTRRLCILAAMVLTACGPQPVEDEAADQTTESDFTAESSATESGIMGDPWNCGELGETCVGPLGIGDCIDGVCRGRLGSCYGPFGRNCDELCALDGFTCAQSECEGVTAFGWMGSQQYADTMCISGDKPSAVPLNITCDESLDELATTVNCCCT